MRNKIKSGDKVLKMIFLIPSRVLNLSKEVGILSNARGMFRKLSIIFTFIPILISGQVTVEWSNNPGGVSVTTDQMQHVYSVNWDYNPAGDITLTKRNTSGEVLWNTTYDNTDNTKHEVATWVETDSQNNCIVSGTIRSGFSNPVNAASILMKFEPNGDLLWRVVFDSSFDSSYTKKILVDNEDSIYVLGAGIGTNGLVTRIKKFDSSGNTLWTFHDNNGIGAPVNIKFTPDNHLIISGRGTTGTLNGYLKMSTNGIMIWSKVGIISPTIGDASGDSTGNTYLINGENVVSNAGSIIQKIDPTGNLVWSQTNSMSGSLIETGSDDKPIISGFPSINTGGVAFIKYNPDGTVLWQNLDADGPEILLSHGQLKLDVNNNAYLSAGNLFNMAVCKISSEGTNNWVALISGSNSAESFTLDTDGSVYVIGGTTAKLSQGALNTMANDASEFLVLPNPFDSNVSIVMKKDYGKKEVIIHTINGVKILELNFNGLYKNIPLFNLNNGIYILTIIDQNGGFKNIKLIKK